MSEREKTAMADDCPRCRAKAGEPCTYLAHPTRQGKPITDKSCHPQRLAAARPLPEKGPPAIPRGNNE